MSEQGHADNDPSAVNDRLRQERAWLLVGRFMHQWSDMEQWLGAFIHKLLGLKFAEGVVVTTNVGFENKLRIFSTAVDTKAEGKMTPEWREEAISKIDKLRRFSRNRNIVAHNYFDPAERDGVDFYTVRARGKFSEDVVSWSENDFKTMGITIDKYSVMLMQLMNELYHTGQKNLEPRAPNELLDPLIPRFLEPHLETAPPHSPAQKPRT